jgi:hypothetical protein
MFREGFMDFVYLGLAALLWLLMLGLSYGCQGLQHSEGAQ